MVRLVEESTPLTEGSSSSTKRRARSESSLDYKINRRVHPEALVVGAAPQKKSMPDRPEYLDAPARQHYRTRARGAGGIPPLHSASDEDTSMWHEDPELAAGETIMAGGAGSSKTPKSRRTATSLLEAQRLDMLKEQGIPYHQWAITLLILGFGLYKLYHILKPQPVPAKKKNVGKTVAERTLNTTKADDEIAAELADVVGNSKKAAANTKKGTKKKKKEPRAVKPAAIKPTESSQPLLQKPIPIRVGAAWNNNADGDDTTGNDDTDDGEWTTIAVKTTLKASSTTDAASQEDDKTVHHSNTSSEKHKSGARLDDGTRTPPPPGIIEESSVTDSKAEEEHHYLNQDSNGEENENATNVVVVVDGVGNAAKINGLAVTEDAPKTNGQASAPPKTNGAAAAPHKKPKKKKNKAAAADSSATVAANISDEELALQLQQQEDQLAAAVARRENHRAADTVVTTAADPTEEWEQVPTKKKKPGKDAATEAGGETVAATSSAP